MSEGEEDEGSEDGFGSLLAAVIERVAHSDSCIYNVFNEAVALKIAFIMLLFTYDERQENVESILTVLCVNRRTSGLQSADIQPTSVQHMCPLIAIRLSLWPRDTAMERRLPPSIPVLIDTNMCDDVNIKEILC